MSGDELIPADFSGTVRLFPLPNLVLFPHVVQPLRVFEPRYLRMLEDALADDQLLSVALLRPGWETGYAGAPPIYPTVCVGRVVAHNRQPDATYHILVAGAARACIRRELPEMLPYRRAEVELLDDNLPDPQSPHAQSLQTALLTAFRSLSPGIFTLDPALQPWLEGHVRLGVLTDVIAFALPLHRNEKQRLLEECSVEQRAARLIDLLHDLRQTKRATVPISYPIPFSNN
jgi:ATP-dependent Lon protease